MQISVLGGCRAQLDGVEVDLGSRKPRAVLTALAMTPGRPVPADRLADLVWGDAAPRAAHGSLHSYVSGLRRVLEPTRLPRGAGSVLETTDFGYVLRVDADAVDAHRFAAEVRDAERLLAPLESQLGTGPAPGWPDRAATAAAVDRLETALEWWSGEPYGELPAHEDVVAERAALEQLRARAEESRLLGLLALGELGSVLASTESATARSSLREQLWALHALALSRSGRQADALEALRTLRELLADSLGLDPDARVRALESAILRQDPAIALTLPEAAARAVATAPAPALAQAPGDDDPVGRESERAALAAVLDRARSGRFGAAVLVGEPGIGKTRLVDDLAARARAAGVGVAVGRCSQDDGAPPLWPWRSALADLGIDLGRAVPDEDAFATRDRVTRLVLDAAAAQPVLLVLDDLHWADDATLRTLAHLVATAPADAPVAVVATRRTHPEPAGSLALVGEALARRHAERLELGGLGTDDARTLLDRVCAGEVAAAVAGAWHRRSGGNPFFLVELARLGVERAEEVPATVSEVVLRRLERLPEQAAATLATAAVAGRRFRAETVSAATGRPLDDVLDDLDAALGADLLVEADDETFTFTHALARDAVYLAQPEHRRARRHAQVAQAFEADPLLRRLTPEAERTAELARHWLAAGSSHAGRAWRAADAAADQARTASAYAAATDLRSAAVRAHQRATDGVVEERYRLLLELATDAAQAARWPEVEAAAVEAVSLGRALGSPALVGEAASTLSRYCVWLPHETDVVVEDCVDDLRWALAHLADGDHPTRARVLLSLAVELYYQPGSLAERRSLAEAGFALAQRVDDPTLTWWAARAAWMATWVPELAGDGVRYAEAGVDAARRAGDPAAESVLLLTAAVSHLGLGRVDRWDELAGQAAVIATERHLPYVLISFHWMEMSFAGLRDDPAGVARHLDVLLGIAPDVAVPLQHMLRPAAELYSRLWNDSVADLAEPIVTAHRAGRMAAVVAYVVLARSGLVTELREVLAADPLAAESEEFWSLLSDWSQAAEAASVAGSVALASRARDVLAPYADRMALAGAVMTMGPVAGYLALAHHAAGEPGAATRCADDAAAQAERWGFTAYAAWLAGHRERCGF